MSLDSEVWNIIQSVNSDVWLAKVDSPPNFLTTMVSLFYV